MKVLSIVILTLSTVANVVWGVTAACSTKGFGYSKLNTPGSPIKSYGCVCKFAGACDMNTGVPSNTIPQSNMDELNGIAPGNMGNFASGISSGTSSVGTICEEDTVAILYDCNARSPLYAATMITGPNAKAKYERKGTWKKTNDPELLPKTDLLANDHDFSESTTHKYCYMDLNGKSFDWNGNPCPTSPTPCSIHKGHLIAASYGRGSTETVKATFTYTNAVPQVASFNSGKWRIGEQKNVVKWAAACQDKAALGIEARVYVVVGVVPSSFLGKPRYFGASGFSNFQQTHPRNYVLSFPEIIWTAGCCMYTDGTFCGTVAFWRRNWPTKDPLNDYATATSVGDMFNDIAKVVAKEWPGVVFTKPKVFPNEPKCA